MDEQTFQRFMNDKEFALKEARKAFTRYIITKVVVYGVIAGLTIVAVKAIEKKWGSDSEVISEEVKPL